MSDDRGSLTDRDGDREPITPVVPGSSELLTIAMKVNGAKDSITTIAKRWRTTAGNLNDHAIELTRAVNTVDHSWQGDSADAFDDYMRKYRKAGDALHVALTDCAGALDTAAGALDTAETKVKTLTENLVTEWNTYRTNNSKNADGSTRTEAELAAGIKPSVDTAVSNARLQLDNADKAVTKATTDLKKYMDERSIHFSDIPAVGDQKFMAPDRVLHWEKTPLANPGQTTLAGTNGGNGGNGGNGASLSGSGGSGGNGPAGGDPGGPAQALPYVPGSGSGAAIVAAAQKHIGKPYVWGADGPSAFDCSGLVYYTLNQAGIKIGDTTAAGYQASGQPITPPPQPGDIVFFGDPATHVGIYAGEGKMIHAPRPGTMVRVEDVAGAAAGPITYRRFT
ncbi:NlpC/P60 family protein [Streptosporangium roseum]|uniref:Cell wall-associated hydrolase (Invasion-associated protein)-like protein n=1 Tax=Streptosporangium roseum (strain ATCC 12428 / DSM 43021 / JCM 3005 / KCTC 9067 / NCIMB 10171 / NRRL 2505 / NI 9100) TaxID=479432 RepID=D2AX31_STRRD|nr:NlpC/P60 family protein [Streptosporangium roseum]ACZ90758.1 Cell wall-associated hydrolase (invasion- associated protein)-like protein [Streptosporangium roseum DSM 43021]